MSMTSPRAWSSPNLPAFWTRSGRTVSNHGRCSTKMRSTKWGQVCLFFHLWLVTVKLLHASWADAMGKRRLGMFLDISFDVLPIVFVTPDFSAGGANRQ